jgi:hypothetical protein
MKKMLKQGKEIKDRMIYNEPLRMSLLTGFYYNISKKVANSNQDYVLLAEG